MTDHTAAAATDDRLDPMAANPEDLQVAAAELERCLAAPSATTQWRGPVVDALARARSALQSHVSDPAEGARVADSVVADAPRLAGQAARLIAEHDQLLERQRAVSALAEDGASAPEDVRDSAAELAVLMRRHVQLAHDLMYDAFESDLGDGD